MDLELKIQNFGPIDEATIQVGRFTVFAGPKQYGQDLCGEDALFDAWGDKRESCAYVF